VRQHPYFANLDWKLVELLKVRSRVAKVQLFLTPDISPPVLRLVSSMVLLSQDKYSIE